MKTTTKPRGLLLPGGANQIRLLLAIAERGEGVLLVPMKHDPAVATYPDNRLRGPVGSAAHSAHGLWSDAERDYWLTTFAPYRIGETRWIKEPFALSVFDPEGGSPADDPENWDAVYRVGYVEGGGWTDADGKRIPPPWRAARTMPRDRSRLAITFRTVTAKQLRDVTEDEAQAAGIEIRRQKPIRTFRDYGPEDVPDFEGWISWENSLQSAWKAMHASPYDPAAWCWVFGVEVCRK